MNPEEPQDEHYAYGWGRTRLVQEIDWLREQYARTTATLAEVSAERDRLRAVVGAMKKENNDD